MPGTLGRLSYVADINKYFRALAAASPRTKLFSLGMSDEGREMIVLAIADEATIAESRELSRRMLARLADPRGLSAADKRAAHSRSKADLLADAARSTRRRREVPRC